MNDPQAGGNPARAALRQRLAQGFEYLKEGRFDQAVPLAEQLAAEHPGDPEVRFLACEANLGNNQVAKALEHIDAAVAAAPGHAALLLKRAHVLTFLRRRHDARQSAEAAAASIGKDS